MKKSVFLLIALVATSSLVSAQVLTIEAEDFSQIQGAMELITDTTVGGDGTVVGVPNNAVLGTDKVSYSFRVNTSGSYYFRGRALAPTGADDSFCVRIEQADGTVITPTHAECSNTDIYWDFAANANWQEMNLMNGWNGSQTTVYFNLVAAETYTITLRRRETGLLLDWLKLYLAPDAEPKPDPALEASQDTGAEESR